MLDEKVIQIYEDNLEDQPMVSEATRTAHKNLRSVLDDYINAVCQDDFVWGYELGRKAGMTK